jgi:hypothetical protein
VDLAEIRQQITHLVDGRGHDGRSGERPLPGNEVFVRDDRTVSGVRTECWFRTRWPEPPTPEQAVTKDKDQEAVAVVSDDEGLE